MPAPSLFNFFPFHAVFGKIFPNNRFLAQTQWLVAPVRKILDHSLQLQLLRQTQYAIEPH